MKDDASAVRRSDEARRKLITESLNVGNPRNNARNLPNFLPPQIDCQLDLLVDEIKPYERNPRRANNAKFDEIKESIRVSGIRNPITVTRRPSESHFIVEAGGNTRLAAIQQLWTETKEPRFQKITVMFRPWCSESHVLTAHLAENDQRSELTFWDKANGVVALKAELEHENGRQLSLRELEEDLKRLGLPVDRTTLSRFQFVTSKLRALGDALRAVSLLDVKLMQPRLNLLSRYVDKRVSTAIDIYAQVLNPVLHRHGARFSQTTVFDAAQLCGDCEQALATHFQEPVSQLRSDLAALDKSSERRPTHDTADIVSRGQGTHRNALGNDASRVEGYVTSGDTERVPKPLRSEQAGQTAFVTAGDKPLNAFDAAVFRSLPTSPSGTQVKTREDFHDSEQVSALRSQGAARALALQRLKQCASEFARLTDVAQCITSCPQLACGYYMEAPVEALDARGNQPLRRRAWWLLALVCGQMDPAVVRELPESSRWRRANGEYRGDDEELSHLIDDVLGGPLHFDAELADWLLDPSDELATLFWELVLDARELKLADLMEAVKRTDTNGEIHAAAS